MNGQAENNNDIFECLFKQFIACECPGDDGGKKKKKQEELGSLPKMCFQVGFLKLCTLFNFIHG